MLTRIDTLKLKEQCKKRTEELTVSVADYTKQLDELVIPKLEFKVFDNLSRMEFQTYVARRSMIYEYLKHYTDKLAKVQAVLRMCEVSNHYINVDLETFTLLWNDNTQITE